MSFDNFERFVERVKSLVKIVPMTQFKPMRFVVFQVNLYIQIHTNCPKKKNIQIQKYENGFSQCFVH